MRFFPWSDVALFNSAQAEILLALICKFKPECATLDRRPEYSHLNIVLPDWWWFGRSHHFGRQGHATSCPFTMTLLIHWQRLNGHRAYWYCWYPHWLQEDGYESANPIMLLDGNLYAINLPKWIPFWWYRKFEPWWVKKVQNLLRRSPLGQPISSPAKQLQTHE